MSALMNCGQDMLDLISASDLIHVTEQSLVALAGGGDWSSGVGAIGARDQGRQRRGRRRFRTTAPVKAQKSRTIAITPPRNDFAIACRDQPFHLLRRQISRQIGKPPMGTPAVLRLGPSCRRRPRMLSSTGAATIAADRTSTGSSGRPNSGMIRNSLKRNRRQRSPRAAAAARSAPRAPRKATSRLTRRVGS